MHVLTLRIDLRIPASQSLKQKRAAIRPLVDVLRQRFCVSVAETRHQDSWQRAEFGVALVGSNVRVVEELANSVERFVWSLLDVEVLVVERVWADIDR